MNPSTIGGTWAYALVDEDDNLLYSDSDVITPRRIRMDGVVTNNQTELLAVIHGLQTIQRDRIIHVFTDSKVTLMRVFNNASMNNIPDWMIDALDAERKRLTQFKKFPRTLLDGHPTAAHIERGYGKHRHPVSRWNIYVDHLCQDEARKYVEY